MKKYHIAYHLVDHCNLNCAGCNHFSPLAKERYASLELFERNIKQLVKLIDVPILNLMGGEPLLHPQIVDFIKIARKYISNKIYIWTNGILLKSMGDDFWNAVNEYNISIRETNYGIIENKFFNTDRRIYNYHWLSTIRDNKLNICPFFESYSSVPLLLGENGLLYMCCVSANIHHYNNYYGTDIELIKNKDYFNIYDYEKGSFLLVLKKIRRPFCDYCRAPVMDKWEQFNESKNLWISK